MAPGYCWNWGEWGLKEYKWKWFLVCWACRSGTRDFCSAYRPSKKYFFLTIHYFNSFFLIEQLAGQAAGQAAVPGLLSFSMCLCVRTRIECIKQLYIPGQCVRNICIGEVIAVYAHILYRHALVYIGSLLAWWAKIWQRINHQRYITSYIIWHRRALYKKYCSVYYR